MSSLTETPAVPTAANTFSPLAWSFDASDHHLHVPEADGRNHSSEGAVEGHGHRRWGAGGARLARTPTRQALLDRHRPAADGGVGDARIEQEKFAEKAAGDAIREMRRQLHVREKHVVCSSVGGHGVWGPTDEELVLPGCYARPKARGRKSVNHGMKVTISNPRISTAR